MDERSDLTSRLVSKGPGPGTGPERRRQKTGLRASGQEGRQAREPKRRGPRRPSQTGRNGEVRRRRLRRWRMEGEPTTRGRGLQNSRPHLEVGDGKARLLRHGPRQAGVAVLLRRTTVNLVTIGTWFVGMMCRVGFASECGMRGDVCVCDVIWRGRANASNTLA